MNSVRVHKVKLSSEG